MQQQLIYLYLFDTCLKYLQKHQARFCLAKYEHLKISVEYVGRNIMQYGNTPENYKLNITNVRRFTEMRQSLQSCIGPINFYLRYVPHFDIILKPKEIYTNAISVNQFQQYTGHRS